ncbi:MAG: lysophospholipid acyltransferase family protein [Bryobacterales bacterium]|nr:lysophospholipid acyltransferase family protein [Bryobacteraceae bacterium]MDW8131308.1 lysophospholipid acyltransferase family protein [Bryobacterales bacterium]
MKKRSRLRDGIEYLVAHLLLGLLARLPYRLAEAAARAVMCALVIAVPGLRRRALRNLELAMPELEPAARRRIVRGMFRSLARMAVVFARLPRLDRTNISRWIRYEGFEHFQRALARGRGVLFAAAHLGNWELSAYAHGLLAGPMDIVVRPLDNPLLDRLVARRRTLCGNRLIPKREAARAVLKALRANRAVGILIDQNAAPSEGVFVDFFGLKACAGAAFARLAARSGATVIPGFALWSETEGRYILRFYPPVELSGDVREDTQRLHSLLESVIRQHPEQWLWIHRRWKTRPPGEPPLY